MSEFYCEAREREGGRVNDCCFFVLLRSGQKWLNWIKYISWFYYANEAAVINQWADVDVLPCDNLEKGVPCVTSGDGVLDRLNFSKVKTVSLSLTHIFIVAFLFL